jgi:Holliday junction resolvase RusA-like endonuclease
MREAVSFIVPLVPPSVNHYKVRFRNGNTVVTAEALAFKQAIALYARGGSVCAKTFVVRIKVVLPKKARGDVDNFPKLCMDGMADAGVFRDLKGKRVSDARVRRLVVDLDSDWRPDEGRTIITVEALT